LDFDSTANQAHQGNQSKGFFSTEEWCAASSKGKSLCNSLYFMKSWIFKFDFHFLWIQCSDRLLKPIFLPWRLSCTWWKRYN
jgi:hypothetical protein